jgi:hypothetical protein
MAIKAIHFQSVLFFEAKESWYCYSKFKTKLLLSFSSNIGENFAMALEFLTCNSEVRDIFLFGIIESDSLQQFLRFPLITSLRMS